MMHSTIAAMAAHTPAMAMAYDRKTIALFDLMGLNECCVPIAGSTADGLYGVFENVILQHARLRERICQRLDELSHVTDGHLQSVRSLACN
jgi:polysaccharide pyruvyl transferase WcaK-like protein